MPLNPDEQYKLKVLNQAVSGHFTNSQTSKLLQILVRQVQRLKKQVKENGVESVVHRLKGKVGNHSIKKSIDDATGKITHAYFDFNEGIIPVFNFWMEYVKAQGKPLGIYLDKFSTYKINHKSAVDNSELMTQFQKAMKLLNIQVINANSPEAKGRVERLFGTLQDRLVKELRLNNISSISEANLFLSKLILKRVYP